MAECVFGLADLPPVPAARVFEVLQGDRYDRQAGPKCFLVVLHDDAGDHAFLLFERSKHDEPSYHGLILHKTVSREEFWPCMDTCPPALPAGVP